MEKIGKKYILRGELEVRFKDGRSHVIMEIVCHSENEAIECMEERRHCYKNMKIIER